MRIPAELVPPISPIANTGKETDDVRKVEPVTSLTNLRDTLSAPPQDQSPPPGKPGPRGQQAAPITQPENPPVAVERRQKERRSEKQPTLLDTRSKKGRRQVSWNTKINIEV